MIMPSVADKGTSRPSSGKSDSSKSPVTSSDEGDSEYISYSDGSSEGVFSILTLLQICWKRLLNSICLQKITLYTCVLYNVCCK